MAERLVEHAYLSTACLHGEHGYCQSDRCGTKVPAVCKFCSAPCGCDCHRPESGRERSPEPAACGCPITLETTRVTRHSRECSVRQAAERIEAGIEDERPAECCCAGCIGMGPCDDDLGKSEETDGDDCCDGSSGVPGVDCDCYWRMGTDG